MSHAPAAALRVNAYLDRLPAAAQSYARTDSRLEGVQEASSSGRSAQVTAGADLPLLGLERAIRKVGCPNPMVCLSGWWLEAAHQVLVASTSRKGL